MNKKQVISLLVATAVFVVTGVSSVMVNTWSAKQEAANAQSSVDAFSSLFGGSTETLPMEDYGLWRYFHVKSGL